MFDKKSLYMLNKKNSNAIVYTDADGKTVLLTKNQFSSEEEFRKWKKLSDSDYKTREKNGRGYYDHTVSLIVESDTCGEALEDMLIAMMEEREYRRECVEQVVQIHNILTETQFRRIWLHSVERKTEQEIAAMEKVSQQAVAKSIRNANKKISENFSFTAKKGCKNT